MQLKYFRFWLTFSVVFSVATIPAHAQQRTIPLSSQEEGYYGTTVLQLNPTVDANGQCSDPFSSGTGFQGTPQWVHHNVDLSAFANKMVAIRFFFDTNDSLYNKFQGWFIDNINITPRIFAPGAAPDSFFDNTESGNRGWLGGGNQGSALQWHITTRQASSGTHSWWFGNEATGTYQPFAADCGDVRSFGALLSPVMKLGNNPHLEFDTLWQIESVDAPFFDLMKVQVEVDSDEDGLLDGWETDGIDSNGDGSIDFVLPGANVSHKDVYIEADYMDAGTHSHNPDPGAINDVVQAFANSPVTNPDGLTGITMHVQVDESMPEQTPLAIWSGFDALKAVSFGSASQRSNANHAAILAAKRLAYHYTIFGHQQVGTTSSGIAELPGNDFFVSLGAFTNQTGTRRELAGTFMHEFGHNLNLRHGGGENTNYKPNYLSIMSYAFQTRGITNLFSGTRIDYSKSVLPVLNENSLSEFAGIGDGFDITRYFCPGATSPNATAIGLGLTDWNCNGFISLFGSVSANVNGDGGLGSLTGFNDWARLKLNFQDTSDYADGIHESTDPQVQPEPELDAFTDSTIPSIAIVKIDIKPGGEPNSINLTSKGVTPVAILSSSDFDAATVVPDSVRFAHSSALRSFALDDVNDDGLPDLVMHFETRSLQLDTTSTMAVLTGTTLSGTQVIGLDTVRIVR
jgi:hypothetical protein